MMTNRILISLLLILTLSSCKNESKNENDSPVKEKEAENKNSFTITINAIVKKDDSFQVFFKEQDDQKPFDEKNSVYAVFKGSDSPQDIVFNLPEDVVPNYVRFDYGINKKQSEIILNSFKISYFGKTFEIKNNELANFISFNEGTLKFNKEKGSITPFILKDGSYDPMSFTSTTLYDKIQQLLRQ